MAISLMQSVLGDDWHKLPDAIRRHYAITGTETSQLQGDMEITYPRLLFPVVWLIHLFGGLILWRGKGVSVQVDKSASADGEQLSWRRMMTYADGKTDYFASRMQYAGDHELIEHIGFGFGLRLSVEACDGDLVYRSRGHFWQFGHLRLTIPDCLLLGHAVIRESAVSDNGFRLDFSLNHPLWSEAYSYRGDFYYR